MSLFDLQKKIFAAINVYAVKNKAGIYDYIPEKAKLPYVVLGDDSESPFDTKVLKGHETTSRIYVWGKQRGMSQVKGLLNTISNLLSVDLGKYEFHKITITDAERETVEFVKGTIEVKYRYWED